MNEVKVTSWNEIGRYRAPHAFRGLSDSSYRLSTTLMRLGGPYTKLEPHLLVNFRRYSGLEIIKFDSMWYWMALGQHHTLPTRLLDWTSLLQTSKNSIEMGLFGWWISKKRLSSYRKFSKTKLNELIRQCFR
ncbi:MAG: FRG domain-containing protein [Candidatus Helarchaeota archaeon]